MQLSLPFKKKERYEELGSSEETSITRSLPIYSSTPSKLLYLLCILLGLSLGLTISFWYRNDASAKCWVPAPTSPIPTEVLGPRIPKAFVPDQRYIGFSKTIDQNWRDLVGM